MLRSIHRIIIQQICALQKTFTRPNGFARKFGAVSVEFGLVLWLWCTEYPQYYEIYIVCLSFYSSSVYWVVLIISSLCSVVDFLKFRCLYCYSLVLFNCLDKNASENVSNRIFVLLNLYKLCRYACFSLNIQM